MLLRYAFCFLASATVPFLAKSGFAWTFLPALLLVFLIADLTLGRGGARVATAKEGYRALLWLYIPLQLALVVWGATESQGTRLAQAITIAIDIGITSGIFGMLAAHEMIHSRHPAERALGLAMLAAVGYMHFRISHVHFHHRLAASLADPATARRGENVYRFVVRSVRGQWGQAWTYERRRTAGRRCPWLVNRMYHYLLVTCAITAALWLVLGSHALVFAALHGAVAVFVLELFNYVAHYGLLRRQLPDDTTEPLAPRHSWNTPQRFTNWALFNSGHHSDHHRRPTAPYERLQAWLEAPLLPAGYAATFCMALCPPLWRKVMDPGAVAMARLMALPPGRSF